MLPKTSPLYDILKARLTDLERERDELLRFLNKTGKKPRTSRRAISRAERKAISERMTKYWASRRKKSSSS